MTYCISNIWFGFSSVVISLERLVFGCNLNCCTVIFYRNGAVVTCRASPLCIGCELFGIRCIL